MKRSTTASLLAVGLGVIPLSLAADDVLALHAGVASAIIQPGNDRASETVLPSLDVALSASFDCPADATAESLTFSVADTLKNLDAAEIADAATLETSIKVPAGQLAPVAAAGICESEDTPATRRIFLPGVATAHVSLRCQSESGTSIHFASRALSLTLTCWQDDNQASSVDR